jgi:hypothetical protein
VRVTLLAALLLAAALYGRASDAGAGQRPREPFAGVLDEHPAIQYASRPTDDRVAALARAVATGARSLEYHERGGYLDAVLEALDVSPESQLLVFSKTGVQRAATGPQTPRALYYNDTVVVGYIAGARLIEIAAQDPNQGVVFYTIDQSSTTPAAIVRRTQCLTCHVSGSTMEVPGMIARSMFTRRDGDVMPQFGSFIVDHRTPLPQRWGGYFVTGNYVAPVYSGFGHMGNVTTAVHATSGPATTSNEVLIEWLDGTAGTRGYPSNESDIAALMIFDHQMRAMNLLTRVNWETRVAQAGGGADFASSPLRALVEDLVEYFLFTDEVAPPAQLTPRPGFARSFVARGPVDRQGRSLRELDLGGRLFRYPCSYMIYTAAFDGLPAAAKAAIYRRLGAILTRRETTPRYAHLSAADRQAIIQILRDTKGDLPEGWGEQDPPA